MAGRKRKKIKRKKGGKLFGLLSVVVIFVVIILAVSVFFNLTDIRIEGVSEEEGAEIIEASGLKVGDNVLFLNKNEIVSKIFDSFAYINEVTISREFPNGLTITINEREEAAYLVYSGTCWIIDIGGRIFKTSDGLTMDNLPKIVGIDLLAPSVGKDLVVAEDQQDNVDYLLELLTTLNNASLLSDIEIINASDLVDFTFDYLERFSVRLGVNDILDYKLSALVEIVGTLSSADTGIINLSEGADKKMYFSPE